MIKLGPFIVTTSRQPRGAPFVDSSTTIERRVDNDEEVARYRGRCFHLTPWRFTKHGDREGGLALVIGRRISTKIYSTHRPAQLTGESVKGLHS